MRHSWSEIRDRAVQFATEWASARQERAEAQTFWNEFFLVFGVSRRRVALFEEPVKRLGGKGGFVDLIWKGTLVVEHKSKGKDLEAAAQQAYDYCLALPEADLPRHVLVSDFHRFRLHDLEEGTHHEFLLRDLPRNTHLFGFMLGQVRRQRDPDSPVNLRAAELMAQLHDSLKANGYDGSALERLLVRLMFCFFADHTGIFTPKSQFRDWLEGNTSPDGSDTGARLAQLFEVLDTPRARRQKNLDEDLAAFEYINGKLFEQQLRQPAFDRAARALLLECASFDWSGVSPEVFGAMFQSVMDKDQRRHLGAHYTSVANILKTISPLFLDELRGQFEAARPNLRALERLLPRIAQLKILDPACGCGNFLVVAYRELRRLEMEIRKEIARHRKGGAQRLLDIDWDKGIDVDSMHGIETEEFPARIAETALWVVDHQMNLEVSLVIGDYYARVPLSTSPTIVHGNAVAIPWSERFPRMDFDYIIGNPPFVGKKRRDDQQAADMRAVFGAGALTSRGELDYVSCWYVRAMEYLATHPKTKVAFVSTNSITQGEQVGVLWPLLRQMRLEILFAHRTFRWDNKGPGMAQVHVVIIGFGLRPLDEAPRPCRLFDYETPESPPIELSARRINPYLVDHEDVFLSSRRKPLGAAPRITFGSMPNDGGHLLLTPEERRDLIKSEAAAKPYIRRFLGARNAMDGSERFCLWLEELDGAALRGLPEVRQRIAAVKEYRLLSDRAATRRLAETPHLFGEVRQPRQRYIVVPRHSAESRRYIPLQYEGPNVIVGDACTFIASDDDFIFGVVSSAMHMAWVRVVAGRIKSDIRYSNEIVYNNFPWPLEATDDQREAVRGAVHGVLAARGRAEADALGPLYDPLAMPRALLEAHRSLDRAVDRCYRRKAFKSDAERVALLFAENRRQVAQEAGGELFA